jgi:hypothetical protein
MSRAPSEIGMDRGRTGRDDSHLKTAKPDNYYGDRYKLEDWITQMELYFTFQPTMDEKKALFAATFFRGRAQAWVKPYLQKYLNPPGGKRDPEVDGLFANFDHMKRGLRLIFGISNDKSIAVRAIQHLRQNTSASEYASKFQQHANVTDWDDDALMEMFRRGLKDSVKDELMRDGRRIDSLGTLIQVSIDLDDKLYDRAMERKHDFRPRGRGGFQFPGNQRQDRGDPMELDATHKGKKRFPKKQQQNNRKKQGGMTCYACNKKGHMARDCRTKGKVPRTQINSITRTIKELNTVTGYRPVNHKPSDHPRYERAATRSTPEPEEVDHDTHTLDEGAVCLDDNCELHEADKESHRFHFMLSTAGCKFKRTCKMKHFGTPGVPMEIREINMMSRRPKKEKTLAPWNVGHPHHAGTSWVDCDDEQCNIHDKEKKQRQEAQEQGVAWDDYEPAEETPDAEYLARQEQLRGRYNINHVHHPDHGTISWENCIHPGCPAHQDEHNEYLTGNDEDLAEPLEGQGLANIPPVGNPMHPDHGILHWTACAQRETCAIHRENMGNIPQSISPLQLNEEEEVEVETINTENPDNAESVFESTPEGSEYDSTDDEEKCDLNHVQFASEAPKPVIKMIKIISKKYKDVFPVYGGKTYLDPILFDSMLKHIRAAFWTHRLVPVRYKGEDFVQWYPPIGSYPSPNGILAPDGTFFNNAMRNQVGRVKGLYQRVHEAQMAAVHLMTTEEYNDDPVRAKLTINHVRKTLPEVGHEMPECWNLHYIEALREDGYPEQKPHPSGNEQTSLTGAINES